MSGRSPIVGTRFRKEILASRTSEPPIASLQWLMILPFGLTWARSSAPSSPGDLVAAIPNSSAEKKSQSVSGKSIFLFRWDIFSSIFLSTSQMRATSKNDSLDSQVCLLPDFPQIELRLSLSYHRFSTFFYSKKTSIIYTYVDVKSPGGIIRVKYFSVRNKNRTFPVLSAWKRKSSLPRNLHLVK